MADRFGTPGTITVPTGQPAGAAAAGMQQLAMQQLDRDEQQRMANQRLSGKGNDLAVEKRFRRQSVTLREQEIKTAKLKLEQLKALGPLQLAEQKSITSRAEQALTLKGDVAAAQIGTAERADERGIKALELQQQVATAKIKETTAAGKRGEKVTDAQIAAADERRTLAEWTRKQAEDDKALSLHQNKYEQHRVIGAQMVLQHDTAKAADQTKALAEATIQTKELQDYIIQGVAPLTTMISYSGSKLRPQDAAARKKYIEAKIKAEGPVDEPIEVSRAHHGAEWDKENAAALGGRGRDVSYAEIVRAATSKQLYKGQPSAFEQVRRLTGKAPYWFAGNDPDQPLTVPQAMIEAFAYWWREDQPKHFERVENLISLAVADMTGEPYDVAKVMGKLTPIDFVALNDTMDKLQTEVGGRDMYKVHRLAAASKIILRTYSTANGKQSAAANALRVRDGMSLLQVTARVSRYMAVRGKEKGWAIPDVRKYRHAVTMAALQTPNTPGAKKWGDLVIRLTPLAEVDIDELRQVAQDPRYDFPHLRGIRSPE